jgi:hypothetical protein
MKDNCPEIDLPCVGSGMVEIAQVPKWYHMRQVILLKSMFVTHFDIDVHLQHKSLST